MNKDTFKIHIKLLIESEVWWYIAKGQFTKNNPDVFLDTFLDLLVEYAYEGIDRDFQFDESISCFKNCISPYDFMDTIGGDLIILARLPLENKVDNDIDRIKHLCIIILFARYCCDKNKYFDLILIKFLLKEELDFLLSLMGDNYMIAG
jgi:hypothetical protein